jgi:lysophospholipase L1-like esterase
VDSVSVAQSRLVMRSDKVSFMRVRLAIRCPRAAVSGGALKHKEKQPLVMRTRTRDSGGIGEVGVVTVVGRIRVGVLAGCMALALLAGCSRGATDVEGWVGTWGASPVGARGDTAGGFAGYSIRNVIHTSVGGTAARVRLSNAFGGVPVLMAHVTLAVAATAGTADAVAGSVRELTFDGRPSVSIPAGAELSSDPVDFDVPADADLFVTTYTPEPSGPVTYHPLATETSFYTRGGDHSMDTAGAAYDQRTDSWHYVSEVDVQGSGATGTVVAFGDSITDGYGSAFGADRRFSDVLADRLTQAPGGARRGVLNAGVGANRLLLGQADSAGRSALARFDDDVLARASPRSVIVFEGINDIQQDPQQTDPAPIIDAYRQLAARARAAGLVVLGGTLTPFKGWYTYTEKLEATRLAVNDAIRTGGLFDAVIDFDAVLRDPADPAKIKSEFASADHLHPNDDGYQAMVNAIPLDRL